MLAATPPTPLPHLLVPDFQPAVLTESEYYYSKGNETQQQVHEPKLTNQQHPNGAFESMNPPCYDANNFEIANRVFYATINKFTRQACSDPSKRRSPPYSFLESWHLHNIYSKSQQTLLGITPVRPSVILSGDDFMFTPPFIQQFAEYDTIDEEETIEEDDYMCNDDEFDDDDHYWTTTTNNFYTLSPCPETIQHGYLLEHSNNYDDGRDGNITANTTPISLFGTQNTKYEGFIPVQEADYVNLQHENVASKDPQDSLPVGVLSIEIPQENDTNAIYIDLDNDTLSPAVETPVLSPSSIPDDQTALSRSSSISSLETDNEKNTQQHEHRGVYNFDSNCNSQQHQSDSYLLSSYSSSSTIDLTIHHDSTITSTSLPREVVPTAASQEMTSTSPVTRSSLPIQKSLLESTCSVLSYQSFADIINLNNTNSDSDCENTFTITMTESSSMKASYDSIKSSPVTDPVMSTAESDDNYSSSPPKKAYSLYDEELGETESPISSATKGKRTLYSTFCSCFRYLSKKMSNLVKYGFNRFFSFSTASERQPLL